MRHLTVIALVAVMMLIAKTLLRMQIEVSGHGGVLWIAALLVGTAVVRRPGASLMMGFLAGTLVALFQPGDATALFTVAKYVLPGLVLDVLAPLLGYRFDQWLPAILAGAAAHASKVAHRRPAGGAGGSAVERDSWRASPLSCCCTSASGPWADSWQCCSCARC